MSRKKKQETEPTRLRKNHLAGELGISRVTLDKYLNQDGAPHPDKALTYSIEETAQWIASQRQQESKLRGKSYWEAEMTRLKCERLAEEIARERGDWIHKTDASKTIVPLMRELSELMQQKFVRELPSRYKGHDAIECAQMNADACDAIAKRFRDGIKTIALSESGSALT